MAEKFTVYNIDEFRTSKLNYKTEEVSGNLSLPDKKNEVRKIHSILTYKTEKGRMGCINRDENAVNNMIKIVESYLKDGTRPEKYTRSYKFPIIEERSVTKNVSNPSVKLKTRKLKVSSGQASSVKGSIAAAIAEAKK